MEVVPVNFGLKYKPPKLGVEYYLRDQPETRLVHEIPLSFINKGTLVDLVSRELVEKNKFYLNPKIVSLTQIKRLVERMVRYVSALEDKENESNNRKQTAKQISTYNPKDQGKKPEPSNNYGQNRNANVRQSLADNSPQSEQSIDMSHHQSLQQIREQEAAQANHSISRIESLRDENEGGQGGDVDLLISEIQHNQSVTRGPNGQPVDHEDLEQLLKTGAFTKEMMMGQTIRDLGSTIKEDKGQNQQLLEASADYQDDFEDSQQHQDSQIINNEEFSQ